MLARQATIDFGHEDIMIYTTVCGMAKVCVLLSAFLVLCMYLTDPIKRSRLITSTGSLWSLHRRRLCRWLVTASCSNTGGDLNTGNKMIILSFFSSTLALR